MKKIRSVISIALAVLLMASLLPLSVFAKADTLGKAVDGTVSFDFAISHFNGKEPEVKDKGLGHDTVYYSDSWFKSSAFIYNHELATASLAAGMTATSYDTTGTGYVPTGDERVVKFLNAIGCEKDTVFTERFEICNAYDDASAFACGVKSIPGTDMYLLPVIIRSNGYGGEWASNVRVYDKAYEGYSVGFRKAAEYVAGYLDEYIDSLAAYGIDRSDLKLWISGFSRGGSVANNLGQIMTDTSGIAAENIYVYGFAVPETVDKSIAAQKDYANIFSVCSEIDLVPRIPLIEWGYTHFGTTLSLPCMSKSKSAYDELLPGMQEEFKAIMKKIGLEGITNEPVAYQDKAIDLLISYLMDPISTPQEYKNEGWQDLIEGLVKNWKSYDNDIEDITSLVVNAFIPDGKTASLMIDFLKNYNDRSDTENYAAITKVLTRISLAKSMAATKRDAEVLGMVYDMVSSIRICIMSDYISAGQSKSMTYYKALVEVVIGLINDGFTSDLFMQHWPESYMAWMRSASGDKLFTTKMHTIVPIKTPLLVGDVNGDGSVNKTDVTKLNQYVLAPKLVKIDKTAADIDGNGRINLTDVAKLNQLVKLVK